MSDRYPDHVLGVVVPAYNEEGFVGEVIETIPDYVDRVYPVDDCSTDGTWAEIREAAERANAEHRERGAARMKADGGPDATAGRVVPIRHEENRGVGAAIKTGLRRARRDGVDVAAIMDGDGQMDPDILHRFVDPIVEGRADYAKGNRFLADDLDGMSGWRHFGNVSLTLLTKAASGYWRIADPQNGYNALSMDVLDRVDLDRLYDGYGFRNDLLIALNVVGARVADVAMPATYGEEVSDIDYGPFIRSVSTLLATGFLWRLNVKYALDGFHPLLLFYYAGVLAGVLGVVALTVGALTLGGAALGAAVVVGVVLACFAVLFVLLAMTFESRYNENLELKIRA